MSKRLMTASLAGLWLAAATAQAAGLADAVDQQRSRLGQGNGGPVPAATARPPAAPSGQQSGAWHPERLNAADVPLPAPKAPKALFAEHPRIDPALLEFAELAQQKGSGADLAAKAVTLDLAVSQGKVAVRLSGADPQALERQVRALGGEVTARFQDVVYARVPAPRITELSGAKSLDYAAPQPLYHPMTPGAEGPLGEGVGRTGADRLHQAGITGKGVKVGILDFGFQRYSELQGRGRVPAPVAARPFNGAGQLETSTVHGTACAEIIHEMAPDAQLYLAAVDGAEDQIVAAAQWLVSQGVNIISFSGGGHGGPLNGRALLDRMVDSQVREQGVLWTIAAGNEGDSHWLGATQDRNGNGFVDITGREADLLLIQTDDRVNLLATWDDWGTNPESPAASQDLDLFLIGPGPDGKPVVVAASERPQQGSGQPMEFISGQVPAGVYGVVLRATNVSRPVRLHLLARGSALEPVGAAGSVASPGTAREALTVGAVDVRSDQLESFSSQGPTDDARLKPEVAAPDNNLSAAYGRGEEAGRFPGTSAATPHVAGYAALFKQLHPDAGQAQLRQLVMEHVRAQGSPVPNNAYGHGLIDGRNVQVAGREAEPPVSPPPSGDTGSGGAGQGDPMRQIIDAIRNNR